MFCPLLSLLTFEPISIALLAFFPHVCDRRYPVHIFALCCVHLVSMFADLIEHRVLDDTVGESLAQAPEHFHNLARDCPQNKFGTVARIQRCLGVETQSQRRCVCPGILKHANSDQRRFCPTCKTGALTAHTVCIRPSDDFKPVCHGPSTVTQGHS
jgi:hypothetical protein